MRRRLARPGLSYYDANAGRLITETSDLLDMKARIRARWPNLDIFFDREDRVFVVIQHCEDGVDRLALQRPYCDDRLMEDLVKADPTSPHFVDPIKAVDDHNDAIERQQEHELSEVAGDVGERLIHAFKKDGLYDHEDIGARRKPTALRDRAIR